MDTSIEKSIVRKLADLSVLCLSNMATSNKTHTMILVYAADDFRENIGKIAEIEFF